MSLHKTCLCWMGHFLAVEDLTRILEETMAAAEVPELETDASGKAVDALLGLAAFPAEQVLAMSLSKKGLDLEQLWERKRQVIERHAGSQRVAGWRIVRRHRRVREYQDQHNQLRLLLTEKAGVFRITHPFHPFSGQSFEAKGYVRSLHGQRVYFEDPRGRFVFVPETFTDLVPLLSEPFVALAAGRSYFRVQDLLDLVRIAEGEMERQRSDV